MRVKARAEIAGVADQRRVARLERLLNSVKARLVFLDYNHGSVLMRADPCLLLDAVDELRDLIRRCVFRLTLFVKPASSVRALCGNTVKVSRDRERCIVGRTDKVVLIADISLARDYARVIVVRHAGPGFPDLSNPLLLSPTEFPCVELPSVVNEISRVLPVCRVE